MNLNFFISRGFVLLFLIALPIMVLFSCENDSVIEEGHWVVVGNNGEVSLSYDNGLTWSMGNSGHTQTWSCLTSDTQGLWVGATSYFPSNVANSSIYTSNDGGENWTLSDMSAQAHVVNGIRADKYGIYVIAVGNWLNQMGTIHYSLNGGYNWTEMPSTMLPPLYAVDTDDEGYWVAVGHDGTAIWSTQPTSQWNKSGFIPAFTVMLDVAYIGSRGTGDNNQRVWIAVGGHATWYTGLLLRSLNSGETWTTEDMGSISEWQYFRTVASNDQGTCIAAGDKGLMFVSTNFGDSWTRVMLPDQGITVSVWDIATNGQGLWIAMLSNRCIIHSTDLLNWTEVGPIASQHLSAIDFGI